MQELINQLRGRPRNYAGEISPYDCSISNKWVLQAADAIEKLQAENERLKSAIQEWVDGKCISEKYLLMIGNLQNERDTAVADLKSLSNDNSLCGICKFSECPLSDGICADCKGYPHLIVSNFEWRGEENLNG